MDENRERDYNRAYVKETIKEPAQAAESEDPIKDRFAVEEETPVEEKEFVVASVKESRTASFPRIVKTSLSGILFGLCACLAFYVMSPWADRTFRKSQTVTIPLDQEDPGAETEGNGTDGTGNDAQTADGQGGGGKGTDSPGTDAQPADTQTQTEEPKEEPKEELKAIDTRLYGTAYESLRKDATALNHCMATLTMSGDDSGWFEGNYQPPRTASGVIVAETNEEYLILTLASVLKDATSVKVGFADNTVYPGKIKKTDRNTGLGIVAIEKENLSESTLYYVEVAELGNSYNLGKGTPVILLGSPLGLSGGVAYSTIVNKNGSTGIEDGNFHLMVADMIGAAGASGAVMDYDGSLVGFITSDVSAVNTDALTALPISEVKRIIERLSNGEAIPYMGVQGIDLNADNAAEQGIEQGIYLTEVTMDSPAMEGGLQVGDTILAFDGEVIEKRQQLYDHLLDHDVGDTVRLRVIRAMEELEIKITLGEK